MPIPSRRWTAKALPRFLGLALLVGICCCTSDDSGAADLQAGTETERVDVFLISPQDGGVLGRRVGCGDSAVPVEVRLPRRAPALEGAHRALLDLRSSQYHASGFYNALYASPLTLQTIERSGTEARIRLTGYLEIDGSCDGQRVLAQLIETALQFKDVQRVQFWLDDRPLRDLLLETGGERRGGG